MVETLGPDDATGIAAALARWKDRGFEPRAFEIGTRVRHRRRGDRHARDPHRDRSGRRGQGQRARREHSRSGYGVTTQVHQELVRRPTGTIVARSGTTTIRNPSVLWFQPRKASETLTVADVPTGTGGCSSRPATRTAATGARSTSRSITTARCVAANAVVRGQAARRARAGRDVSRCAGRGARGPGDRRAHRAAPEDRPPQPDRSVPACARRSSARSTPAPARKTRGPPARSSATRGLVVLRDGGGMVDIRYSASCGGHTEDNDAIWGGDPDPVAARPRATIPKADDDAGRPTTTSTRSSTTTSDAWCDQGQAREEPSSGGPRRFRADELDRAGRRSSIPRSAGSGRCTAEAARRLGPDPHARRSSATRPRSRSPATSTSGACSAGSRRTLFEVKREGDAFVFRGAGLRPRRRDVPARRDRHGRGRQVATRRSSATTIAAHIFTSLY